MTSALILGVTWIGDGLQAQGVSPFTIIVTKIQGLAGEVKQSRLALSHPTAPAQGWTVGVCHDPNRATLLYVNDGYHTQLANAGLPADFISTTVLTDGWVGGVIIDLMSVNSLTPGNNRDLHRAYYQLLISSSGGICFCNTLGVPAVSQVVISDGTTFTPATVCAPPIPDDAPFRRGDLSMDGHVIINDAIQLLAFLFNGAATPICMDAADVDDDGLVTIGDGISLLGYLFTPTTAPPAPPGPLNCGEDIAIDNLPACVSTGC